MNAGAPFLSEKSAYVIVIKYSWFLFSYESCFDLLTYSSYESFDLILLKVLWGSKNMK